MNWKLELAKLEFGLLRTESLPEVATLMLEAGLDSPSLRILSGLPKIDTEEILNYWRRTTEELKIGYPSKEYAAWLLIRYYIDQIIEKKIEPHYGIHTIIWDIYHKMEWDKGNKKYAGDSIGIQKLYGLCDSYDDLREASIPWDQTKTNKELLKELQQNIIDAAKEYKEEYLAQQTSSTGSAGNCPASP